MSSNAAFSPPPAKLAKLASACEIGDLADADLTEIFKHLPPYDRLLVSEVCKRWYGISRRAWLEISHLELSPIPSANIVAVIRQCPNLRTVSAARRTFAEKDLHVLSSISLESLSLYDCTVVLQATANRMIHPLSAIFSGNLHAAAWEELVLHDLRLEFQVAGADVAQRELLASSFPTSLKRLQISGVLFQRNPRYYECADYAFLQGIEALRDLECLILHSIPRDDVICRMLGAGLVARLQNLRELHLSYQCGRALQRMLSSFPKLEVLFVHHVKSDFDDCALSAASHPSLRVLVLTENLRPEVEFPTRVRFPNGFESDPLPTLHIFVGARASLKIRFPQFPSDAAKVYPITEPLPVFLEREDIKAIFNGVWIADKIKEAAKNGAECYFYEYDVATALHSADE